MTHQLRGRLVGAHLGEADDVREEDRDVLHRVHVERSEDVTDVPLIFITRLRRSLWAPDRWVSY